MEIEKHDIEAGEYVVWATKGGEFIKGVVIKRYETTFGSKVKDVALKIALDKPRLGRNFTTVRATHCINDRDFESLKANK